ncbi:MAG: quinolinate synthase NadA, partial [Bdellovibrionota bacterium]
DTACACNDCPYMKLNSLEKIKRALETMSPQVDLPLPLREKAFVPLDRMMKITSGQPVQWPDSFQSPD